MGVAKKNIRLEVKKYIDSADDKTVIIIHAMLEAAQKTDALSKKLFEKEIDRRFAEYERGEAKTVSLNDLEKGARAFHKKSQRIAK